MPEYFCGMHKHIIVLIGLCLTALCLQAEIDVEVRYGVREDVAQIPLIVNADKSNGDRLYLSYAWAILIESIVCDGNILPISTAGIIVDEEARLETHFNGLTYVYICPARGKFFYATRLRSEREADTVVAINIPEHWTKLEIKYKVRFADGPVSRTLMARFSRLSLDELKLLHDKEREIKGLVK